MKPILLTAALVLAACTATAPPPPVVAPQGEDRYLPDPRTGFTATLPPPVAQKLEHAWRHAFAGNRAEAERALDEVRTRAPELEPATLIEAFMAIRDARYDDARRLLARVDAENPVARVYQAEIAYRERETRIAYDLYRQIAALPDAPPSARERLDELQGVLFNELYASAQTAAPAEAVRLLREALTFNAGAVEPRILLSQKLVEQRQFEEARRELEPLLNTAPDRPEVQEILAEVDVGRGRYQEAIVRYDRLARRTKEPRYAARLEQIKTEWSAANMPGHYRTAADSLAVTRSDFAVLLYWTVPSVRFAQNLGTPQIAVDIESVPGREEIIRALALGLYDVDPVTRRVGPYRTLTASRVSALLARVLVLRGAQCARGATSVLGACGVSDPLAKYAPDAAVSGADVRAALEQVAKQL
ncbi:MAG TPA: tetratricopeptide repeat protein [Thermoanaerobaculia bacterium]